MPYTGYEDGSRAKEPNPFNPHKAKWQIIPDFPWGEAEYDEGKEISAIIKADGIAIGIIRLPNKETLKWMRERINQAEETEGTEEES